MATESLHQELLTDSPDTPNPSAARSPGQSDESLAELAHNELVDAIVEWRLPPGTRLRPAELAGELRISSTPVRLALTRLQTEGLITGVPRRGMFVKKLSPAGLAALFEARLLLETGAVTEYAHHITPSFIRGLEEQVGEYEALAYAEAEHHQRRTSEKDRDFHRAIVSLSDNEQVLQWFDQTNIHIHAYRSLDPEPRYRTTIEEHRAIVEAFRCGDATRVVAAIRAHINSSKDYYRAVLSKQARAAPRLRSIRDVSRRATSRVPPREEGS